MLSCSNDHGADFPVVGEQGHVHILEVGGVYNSSPSSLLSL